MRIVEIPVLVSMYDRQDTARQINLIRFCQFGEPEIALNRPVAVHIIVAAYGNQLTTERFQLLEHLAAADITRVNNYVAPVDAHEYTRVNVSMCI